MGLDISHDAWRGSYGSFMRWRTEIARVAGLPPLDLMDGFYGSMGGNSSGLPTFYLGTKPDELAVRSFQRLDQSLPIKWDCLKPNPLHELLHHSDCEGEIPAESCGPIADELEKLMPRLPSVDDPGHIGNWRDTTKAFIDGCRAAHAANEPLVFS